MARLWVLSYRLFADERGATAVEYGLLAGLMALGVAGGLGALADLVDMMYNLISSETADVAATVG